VTGSILLTISSKFQIIVKSLVVQNPQTKMREILADPRGIVEFFYRHTSGGWFVGSWRKVLLFLARKFSYRGPMSWYKLQSTLAGKNIGGKLKGDARRHVDEKVYRKAQGQISQISG